MNIIICGNKKDVDSLIGKSIREFGKKYQVVVNIENCTSGEGLFFQMGDDFSKTDLIIIDTEIADDDGIKIATKLRNDSYENDIIFFTRDKERVFESFKGEPLYYIVEGGSATERLQEAFEKAVRRMKRKKEDILSVSFNGETRNIYLQDIYYFQSSGRILQVYYGKDETFEFYTPIGKMENLLFAKGFVRINKGNIVSIKKIKRFNSTEVELLNGEILPLGRSYYKHNKEIMSTFLK